MYMRQTQACKRTHSRYWAVVYYQPVCKVLQCCSGRCNCSISHSIALNWLSVDSRLLPYVAVCCSLLQCVAVCCNVLQSVVVDDAAVWFLLLLHFVHFALIFVSSVLQYVAVYCSVLQYVAVYCSMLQCIAVYCSVLQCIAVCCSVLQCAVVADAASQSTAEWIQGEGSLKKCFDSFCQREFSCFLSFDWRKVNYITIQIRPDFQKSSEHIHRCHPMAG